MSGSATVPVAVRCVSRRTSGQRCVRRDARHRARDARAPNPSFRMTNEKFSMTNFQFRLNALVAACRAALLRLRSFWCGRRQINAKSPGCRDAKSNSIKVDQSGSHRFKVSQPRPKAAWPRWRPKAGSPWFRPAWREFPDVPVRRACSGPARRYRPFEFQWS